MMLKNAIALFVLIALLSSCVSVGTISRNMVKSETSLEYMHDSDQNIEKIDANMSIEFSVATSAFPVKTEVKRKKAWCVPLLFINIWEQKNECFAGQDILLEDVGIFTRESFKEEVQRSCVLQYDTLSNAEYRLEITLDSLETVGPYESSGFFYFMIFVYGYSYSEMAGPALSLLDMSYKLYRKGEIVLEDVYSTSMKTNQLKSNSGAAKFQTNYAISMAEAISGNIKSATEVIIDEVNHYVKNQ